MGQIKHGTHEDGRFDRHGRRRDTRKEGRLGDILGTGLLVVARRICGNRTRLSVIRPNTLYMNGADGCPTFSVMHKRGGGAI